MVALTAALGRLASGDLSSGLDDNLAPQFDGLKADFNAAVARLAEAVGGVAVAAATSAAAKVVRNGMKVWRMLILPWVAGDHATPAWPQADGPAVWCRACDLSFP